MTTKKLQQRIEGIQIVDRARDPEVAHGLEDELLWDFVKLVACGSSDLRTQAKLLLKHKKTPRTRWCA